MAVYSMWP